MLNTNEVKKIATQNDTARIIFKELGTRERSRARINLRQFRYMLLVKGERIVDSEFRETFRKMQEQGIGTVVEGRHGNPTRFVWNYKLRDVADAAVTKVKPTPIKKESEPIKQLTNALPISLTLSLSPTIRAEDLTALIALAKELGAK